MANKPEQRKEPNRGHISGGVGSHPSVASAQRAVAEANKGSLSGKDATRPKPTKMTWSAT